ncbi:uncharacterized protein [Nicotiana sylvestris]|uniref:uncharacterized protein n=1 Tax=Nicotiana sylvestris TaxID=4096 RepID=UPI00388C7E58
MNYIPNMFAQPEIAKELVELFDNLTEEQKAVKGQAPAEHLAENPVDGGYEPLKMYFPDEEAREELATKNSKILPYLHHVQELSKRFTKTKFQHLPRVHNDFVDALASLSSMIQHLDKNFIDPILVKIHDQLAYCAHVEEEAVGKPWFHDIKEYLAKVEYLELANPTQKCTLQRLSNKFFHSGGILYRRTPDLGLLRRVDEKEASKLLEEIHAGTCDPYMNSFVLAKKILQAG